jgi:hypothetical protein
MALTPEEMAELKALEAEFGSDDLTPEEEAELAELERLEEENTAEEIEMEKRANVGTSSGEAFGRSFLKEFTYGFSDEIEAGIDAAFSDKTYDQALEDVKLEYAENEARHPDATLWGMGTGMVASLPVGGMALKGIGAVAKGAKLTANTVKMAMLTGAGEGAIRALGESEDKSLGDLISGVVVGGATGGIVGKSLEVGGKVVRETIGKPLAKKIGNWQYLRNRVHKSFGITTKNARHKLERTLKSQNKNLAQWMDEMSTAKIWDVDDAGNLIKSDKNLMPSTALQSTISENINTSLSAIHTARKDLLMQVDVGNIGAIKRSILDNLEIGIHPGAKGPEFIQVKKKLEDSLEVRFNSIIEHIRSQSKGVDIKTVPSNIKAYDLMVIRKELDQTLKNSLTIDNLTLDSSAKMQVNLRNTINDLIDSSVDKTFKHSDKLYKNDKMLRTELQSLYALKDSVAEDILNSKSPVHLMSDLFTAALAERVTGSKTIGPIFAGLRMASRTPMFSRYQATKLSKIASILEKQGSQSTHLLTRLGVAAEVSPFLLEKVMNGAIAADELKGDPIQRNNADVINKQKHILNLARDLAPQTATELERLIRENDKDALAQIMDISSKDPNLKKYFKDGIGWDGKATNPEDIQTLMDQLDSMDITLQQKLEHKAALRKDGTVPQIRNEQDPFIQYQQRNKDKPRF